MSESFGQVAAAFSRKALVYDEFGRDHPALARMRARVRDHILNNVDPPARILELNAGTGADAVFLARQGFRVHATDIAPGMVAQIRAKIEQFGLQGRLTVDERSFTELDRVENGPFDAILSNLGGLNCIPDLRVVARALPRLLLPGGIVTWVIMPPTCLWEMAAVLKGDWRTAVRRRSKNGTPANVEGLRFMTYYFTPRQVREALGDAFRLVRLEGLAVFSPPADHKEFARRFPRLYRLTTALDDHLATRAPFWAWGDFFVLTLCYSPKGPNA